jgi:hypothetical protein
MNLLFITWVIRKERYAQVLVGVGDLDFRYWPSNIPHLAKYERDTRISSIRQQSVRLSVRKAA